MSGLRDFVTGSDMCTPSDGAGPSNAVSALVNQLLGGSSKTQEQLRDLPMHHQGMPGMPPVGMTPEMAAAAATRSTPGMEIPGLGPQPVALPTLDVDAFLAGSMGQPPPDMGGMVSEFEAFAAQHPQPRMGPQMVGPLPPAHDLLAPQLRAFMDGARARSGFASGPLPPGAAPPLPVGDAVRLRDRATILARQMYGAEQGEAFADAQVQALLASLHIDAATLPGDLAHAHAHDWHTLWKQGGAAAPPELPAGAELAAAANWEQLWRGQPQSQQAGPRPLSTGWAEEFGQQHPQASAGPGAWAEEFQQQETPGAAWAAELEQQEAGAAPVARDASAASAMEATRRLVGVLDADPKMRHSKFLQFLSKMSKGELLLGDNRVVEAGVGDAWAEQLEQQQQQPAGARTDDWAAEFAAGRQTGLSTLPGNDWADQFAAGVADLSLDAGPEELEAAWRAAASAEGGSWADAFDENGVPTDDAQMAEWDAIYARHAGSAAAGAAAGRSGYVFAADNPFLGDAGALEKGRDLFKRGLLTEAALALEAEVQAHPGNAEAWRLLGTVQAENDDDRQAIAALGQALAADPNNLDVLLSLGVSHTNELDQGEALTYLGRWISQHPTHRAAAEAAGPPSDSSQAASHMLRTFEAAASASPADADLHLAVGVLHHLSRRYDGAVAAFQRALELRPGDYSLWNKLGATLANYAHSGDAIAAYRAALELKPNYMRAWTNMGISYANIGDYDTSARFYVRALGMNPGASYIWGYLRTSLTCAARSDLLAAVDSEDLGTLQSALPLQS